MIPVSLTIKGLYSYREETIIDFTSLTEAGLFGIFGAVGSGKSSILEAISFALYGETERLNKSDKRSYNMMNLRSRHLLIDFIFTCGDCDDKYKFTVNAKRNSKNFSDGGKIERQAYIWKDNWTPTELDAEKILGLSYDNFKRTIIIPQGKFQEFLQLKESERVQMLKEIFSLEKFELSPKVSKLSKENEIRVSNVQGQMQALPAYDEELLKEKETQITALENSVKELAHNLKAQQDDEKNLQDLKLLVIDVNTKTTALNALQGKQKDIDELDHRIKQFEKCEQVFKYPIENRNKLQQNIELQQNEYKKLEGKQAVLRATIEVETKKVEGLRDAYTKREVLLQKAAELEKFISIKSLQANIEALSARVEKGEKAVKDEESHLENIKEQLATIRNEIASAESSLPDTTSLINVSNWFNNKKQFEIGLSKAQKDATEALATLSAIKTGIEAKLAELPNEIKPEDFPGSLSIVKEQIDHLTKQYDKQLLVLKDEHNRLQVSQKLNEFAEALKDDVECPLCGSVHHPKVFSVASVTEELKQKQHDIEEIENKKRSLNTALIHLSGTYSNYETHSAQLRQKQHEFEKQKSELAQYVQSFSFVGYSLNDEELVKKQLAEIEQKNAAIRALRQQLDDKDTEAEAVGKKITAYRAAVEKFKTEKAQLEGQFDALKLQVILHHFETELNRPAATLTANAAAYQLEHSQVTKEFEQAEKAVQENNTVLASLTGRLAEIEKNLDINIAQQRELGAQIEALLASEGYLSEQQVEQVLSIKLDTRKEKDKVETFRRELHAATIQLNEATAKIEGKVYHEAAHAELRQTIETLSKDLAGKTEKLVTEKVELQKLNEGIQARLSLEKELDKLTERAENLKVLSNLFRSSGFVNYVSSVYLQNLVNSANQRFYKMTRQKLMLELAEDNAFRVRDFMNNGEVRSVKTLSGGQTFQAALSLALALADNIQHLTKSKQNFFFLDEGFGSLDKESLAIVFDTLKGLRKENRIVGVISHVDEMQQEIPVNLKIVNDIDRGSLVTKSWN